jgi:hypothetical protein
MKRQSYLQQIASGASARRRDGVTVLTPPRQVGRPAHKSIDAFESESAFATVRAIAPRTQTAPKTATAANIAATREPSEAAPAAAHDVAPRRSAATERRPSRLSYPEPAPKPDVSNRPLQLSPTRPPRHVSTPEGSEAAPTPTNVAPAANTAATPGTIRDETPKSQSRPAPRESNAVSKPSKAARPQHQDAAPIQESAVQPVYSRPPTQEKAKPPAAPGEAISAARSGAPVEIAGDRQLRPAIPAPRSPPPREPRRTSLHIGTLEVRVTTPPPAAAATRQATPRQAARSGGTGGRRIARAFGVFGLGQS